MNHPHSSLHALLRTDFPSFIARVFRTVSPGAEFLPNWHIDLIAEHLEAVRRGEISRLIINMPPRALKSICVSVAWPAWLLGHDPAARILAASYAAPLAVKHSLDCRAVLSSEWYRAVFPGVRLSADQNEKHKFMTTLRGHRIATSVGGTLTGEGGNFLIIDDPLNPEQAMGRAWREHTARWFDHTFASRLDDKAKGAMVLVMQRLHAEDLTAHLLAKGGWVHLSLPALAPVQDMYGLGKCWKIVEEGEPLHAARENAELIARARRELGAYAFSAQYQQNPQPQEGGMIKPWWLSRVPPPDSPPLRIVQSWDTAIKSGMEHDASACLTFAEYAGEGEDAAPRAHLLDALVVRAEYPELKRLVLAQAERFRASAVLIEDKASGQQLLQDLGHGPGASLIPVTPRGDKLSRLAAVSALIEAGRLTLPVHAPWLADFEAELLGFPGAAHDDQVDALAHYLDWLRRRPTALLPQMRRV